MNRSRNTIVIARKELEIFFMSPIASIILFTFSLVMGIYFFMAIYDGRDASVVAPFIGNIATFMLMFITPFYTMRLIAEEKRSGTIEILFSAPITDTEIILGKFAGSFIFFLIMLAVPIFHYLLLMFFGKPDIGIIFTNLIGLILMGAAFISIGLLCSTLTKNQIVSAMLSFAILLFLWLVEWVSGLSSGLGRTILGYISLLGHFSNLSKGILDSTDIIFFLTFVIFNLFLASRILADRRTL